MSAWRICELVKSNHHYQHDQDQEDTGGAPIIHHAQIGLNIEANTASPYETQDGSCPNVGLQAIENMRDESEMICGMTPYRRTYRRVAPVAVMASTGPVSIPSIASE
jgi:hypothetical protein